MTGCVIVVWYHEYKEVARMKKTGMNTDKIERVLGIYTKLLNGAIVNKASEAINYGVNERSIQRDIDDIRNFMEQSITDSEVVDSVIYDRQEKGYRLEHIFRSKFSNSEILAICKILVDSRAFTKIEMENMQNKLVECCVPENNQKVVSELIRNEMFHYIEPRHKSVFIDKMWDIGQAIQQSMYIEIKYQGMRGTSVKTRKLQPVAIMFSEYYFYLAAFIDDKKIKNNFNVIEDAFPTIYRIDRIQELKVLKEHYQIPYADRFEEGEFRKRVQFMYGGRLKKIKFRYKGYSVEAVLDRLPTAKILSEENGWYIISAEVFGDGIDMWLRSQGDLVEIL